MQKNQDPNSPTKDENTSFEVETPPAALPKEESPTQPTVLEKLKNFLRKFLRNKKLVIVVLTLMVLGVGSGVYWFMTQQSKKQVTTTQQAQNYNVQSSAIPKTQLQPATIINGNTYFDVPKKLDNLNFFKNTAIYSEVKASDITYYQVGTTKDNKKILIVVVPGGIDSFILFALGNADGTYDILAQMDSFIADNQESYKKSLADNVKINLTFGLNDAPFPIEVTINGQKLKSTWENPSMANSIFMEKGLSSIRGSFYGEVKNGLPQKVADKDGLSYYRVVVKDESTFQVIEVYATLNQLFSMGYNPAGEIAAAKDNLAASWSSGEKNSSKYFSGGQGCGSRGYVTGKNISKSNLIAVGKSPKGQTLYQLSTSSALAQELFSKDYLNGDNLSDDSLKNLNIQQMTDKHAYFLAENGFNEYQLFQREDMFVRGGCDKPVIYLYPEKPTNTSVQVGADVTKSEPLYPKGGWQNVIAYPDGSLKYEGTTYKSLFWEGYGIGAYPEINSGTIVRSSAAVNVIRTQLAQQGLNQNEISDFMAFWTPKLPNDKPYIRITWFNTGQLNQLAPLAINPSPRTTIRVFMDFEGLDRPYSLHSQKLLAPKRVGFTLVEWGGLLRNGLSN